MIGWYVHHHGRGHLHRAQAVIARVTARGCPVTVLSTLPAEEWAPWVELARDDLEGRSGAEAGGVLHYAPTDNFGHRSRLATIAGWVAKARPAAMVVDVSVEVAVVARTMGVPTIVMAMPGRRDDRPHTLGYDLADRIIAPWPGELYRPAHLASYAEKVSYVGGISRHDGAATPAAAASAPQVLLLGGAGGSELTRADLDAAQRATPDWSWTVAGPLGQWHDDTWPLLQQCDVAVIAAGQNSVADVAVAAKPAIVIPQQRPYDEQRATGEVLQRAGLATVRDGWPTPVEWPGLLSGAARSHPDWGRWQTAGAADRAAEVVLSPCA